MIFLTIEIIQGTTIASALFEMSYLANIVRIPVDGGYNDWRLLVQPQDTPLELYMAVNEVFKLKNVEHKAFTLTTFRYLIENLTDQKKQAYTDEYDRQMEN